MSVRPAGAWNSSAPTGRIFVKFDIWMFFEKLLRTFKFHWNWTRMKGILHECQCTFLIISRSILLRMRNVSNKRYRESLNTHFIFHNSFENSAVYETMRKSIVEQDRLQMRIWRMRIACWIPKATNTHTHTRCVILIPFPTTTMVARTRLNVTLYVHCLSCYLSAGVALRLMRFIIISTQTNRRRLLSSATWRYVIWFQKFTPNCTALHSICH